MTGRVLYLNPRGFGRLLVDGEAIFFSAGSMAWGQAFDALRVGDTVTLSDIDDSDPRGPMALGVCFEDEAA